MSDAPISPASEAEKQLQAAFLAFDRGDYRLTRKFAENARSTDDEEVQAQAERLLAQLETPALTKTILVLTFTLLVLVTLFAYSR